MNLESFIVHAVSGNLLDMNRALAWALEDESRLTPLHHTLDRVPALGAAFRFAQPFEQQPLADWRPSD
jgi:hypothetical protein